MKSPVPPLAEPNVALKAFEEKVKGCTQEELLEVLAKLIGEPKPEYEVRTHLARREYVNDQLTDITVASLADYYDRSVCSAEGVTERDALDSLQRKVLSMHAMQLSAVQKARYGGEK